MSRSLWDMHPGAASESYSAKNSQRILLPHHAEAKQSREGVDGARSLGDAGGPPPSAEAPDGTGGVAPSQMCCDKRPWLEGLDVAVDRPMNGKPQRLYLENAAEFKSEALHLGCGQHSIELSYRAAELRRYRRAGRWHGGGQGTRIARHDILQTGAARQPSLGKEGGLDAA